ncbi:hypothetical protein KI387_042409, partial [Taxus chinensis]
KDAMEIRALYLRLMAMISETLGKDYDYVNRIVKKHTQVMNINYYPACPNQDLTFGVAPHLDMCGVIVFIQGDVSSLQVLKDGNAFVVNLADQLQVLNNGIFKRVEHKAITNHTTTLISIPTFYGPSLDTFIAPVESMVDEKHLALYRGYKFEEYMRAF